MTPHKHDLVKEFLRRHPMAMVDLLRETRAVGLPPGLPVRAETSYAHDLLPGDFQPDLVLLTGPKESTERGIIVEIPRAPSEEKRRRLTRHMLALWLALDCPVDVVVLCPDPGVAAFYADPITVIQPGLVFRAVTISPDQIPVLAKPAQVAEKPGLGTLSVLAHGDKRPAVLDGFLKGIHRLPPAEGAQYYEYVHSLAPGAFPSSPETSAKSPGWIVSSPFAKEHFGRGMTEGEADALFLVLTARGLETSEEQQESIATCTDLDQLQTWLKRAATAETTAEIFHKTRRPVRERA
jgi:hypothetical protein